MVWEVEEVWKVYEVWKIQEDREVWDVCDVCDAWISERFSRSWRFGRLEFL